MIPEEVFHYTKREIALEKILFDKKIELRQIGFTNDPRESKERLYSYFYKSRLANSGLPPERAMEIIGEANRIFRKEWKVFCVSKHHPKYSPDTSNIANPLHRGDCRPRMWSHYGENHKGICIRLNGIKFDQRLREELGDRCKVFGKCVTYDDTRSMEISSSINLQDIETVDIRESIREYFKENWEELFLIKSEDWTTEYEYRWLIHSVIDAPEYISIDGVVDGIVVGVDFPEACYPSLLARCDELKITPEKIEWENGVPSIYHIPRKNLRA
jgi:hypothetical protein